MTAVSQSTTQTESRVTAQAGRRRFTVDYKTAMVEEAVRCRAASEIGALRRREGLYSSHLTAWRKHYRAGARRALSTRRGPTPAAPAHPLPRENARLREELARATLVIEIQKNFQRCWRRGRRTTRMARPRDRRAAGPW